MKLRKGKILIGSLSSNLSSNKTLAQAPASPLPPVVMAKIQKAAESMRAGMMQNPKMLVLDDSIQYLTQSKAQSTPPPQFRSKKKHR
jgi:hypothetical protein